MSASSMATAPMTTSDRAGSARSAVPTSSARAQSIPIEQYPDDGSYVIRFEVPGIDPARDLTVSVETGMLGVRAERRDRSPEGRQTEFSYGSYARHVALPLGANARDVSASYHNGILTVRIGMEPEHQHGARSINVEIEP